MALIITETAITDMRPTGKAAPPPAGGILFFSVPSPWSSVAKSSEGSTTAPPGKNPLSVQRPMPEGFTTEDHKGPHRKQEMPSAPLAIAWGIA